MKRLGLLVIFGILLSLSSVFGVIFTPDVKPLDPIRNTFTIYGDIDETQPNYGENPLYTQFYYQTECKYGYEPLSFEELPYEMKESGPTSYPAWYEQGKATKFQQLILHTTDTIDPSKLLFTSCKSIIPEIKKDTCKIRINEAGISEMGKIIILEQGSTLLDITVLDVDEAQTKCVIKYKDGNTYMLNKGGDPIQPVGYNNIIKILDVVAPPYKKFDIPSERCIINFNREGVILQQNKDNKYNLKLIDVDDAATKCVIQYLGEKYIINDKETKQMPDGNTIEIKAVPTPSRFSDIIGPFYSFNIFTKDGQTIGTGYDPLLKMSAEEIESAYFESIEIKKQLKSCEEEVISLNSNLYGARKTEENVLKIAKTCERYPKLLARLINWFR